MAIGVQDNQRSCNLELLKIAFASVSAVLLSAYLAIIGGIPWNQSRVPIPPSIILSSPRELAYRDGENVSLDCKAMGVPDVKYEWTQNGLGLDQTLPKIRKGMDGTITIENATAMDEGFYQCFARNQYGTALTNMTHLQRAFLDSSSGTPSVVPKYLFSDTPFYIACDRRKSFPKPTYIWEKYNSTEDSNPIQLAPTEQRQIDENGDLHFGLGLSNNDSSFLAKLYRCYTNNTHLNLTEGGNYTELQIDSARAQRSDTRGIFSDSHSVALIGRSMSLRCFFYKNRVPITWSGVGSGYALPTGRYRLDPFNTSLTIDNITASDEGPYGCSVFSDQESFGSVLRVRVEAEPMFPTATDAPYDVNVTEGDSFTFNCNVTAKPEAKIVWFQNGKELDPGHLPEKFELSNHNRSLTIRDVCRDCVDQERQTDLMVIQCNASNVHGYAFAQGYLNVLYPVTTGIEKYWWIIPLIVLLLLLVLFISSCCIGLQKKKREKSDKNTANQVSGPGTEASSPHNAENSVDFESAEDTANQVSGPGTEASSPHNAENSVDFESAEDNANQVTAPGTESQYAEIVDDFE